MLFSAGRKLGGSGGRVERLWSGSWCVDATILLSMLHRVREEEWSVDMFVRSVLSKAKVH